MLVVDGGGMEFAGAAAEVPPTVAAAVDARGVVRAAAVDALLLLELVLVFVLWLVTAAVSCFAALLPPYCINC